MQAVTNGAPYQAPTQTPPSQAFGTDPALAHCASKSQSCPGSRPTQMLPTVKIVTQFSEQQSSLFGSQLIIRPPLSAFGVQQPQVSGLRAWKSGQNGTQAPPHSSVPVGQTQFPPWHSPPAPHGVPFGRLFLHLPFFFFRHGPHCFFFFFASAPATPTEASTPPTMRVTSALTVPRRVVPTASDGGDLRSGERPWGSVPRGGYRAAFRALPKTEGEAGVNAMIGALWPQLTSPARVADREPAVRNWFRFKLGKVKAFP
jgi:hypothetical protein